MISQIKEKREWHQINRMRNEREVTTDNTEIQKLQREHYEHFYAKKIRQPRRNGQIFRNM